MASPRRHRRPLSTAAAASGALVIAAAIWLTGLPAHPPAPPRLLRDALAPPLETLSIDIESTASAGRGATARRARSALEVPVAKPATEVRATRSTFQARCLDVDGEPVEGATVTLRVGPAPTAEQRRGEGSRRTAIDAGSRSGPDGVIEWTASPPARTSCLLSFETDRPRLRASLVASTTSATFVDLGDLVLQPVTTVRGRCVDGAGHGLAGVEIRRCSEDDDAWAPASLMTPLVTRSGVDGRFEYDWSASALPTTSLHFLPAESFSPLVHSFETDDRGDTLDLDPIVFERAPSNAGIRGRLLGARGTPIADATVLWYEDGRVASRAESLFSSYEHARPRAASWTRTTRDGSFSILTRPGSSGRVVASDDRGHQISENVESGAASVDLVFTDTSLLMHVRDVDGRPIDLPPDAVCTVSQGRLFRSRVDEPRITPERLARGEYRVDVPSEQVTIGVTSASTKLEAEPRSRRAGFVPGLGQRPRRRDHRDAASPTSAACSPPVPGHRARRER
jgi:hypothetical protein